MAYRPAPSFCGQCGTPWPMGAPVCGACGKPRRLAVPEPPAGMSEGRGLVSALVLYFVFLSTLLAPLALLGDVGLETLDTLLVVDAILVVGWSIAHWRDVLPRLRTFGAAKYWLLALAAIPVTVGLAVGNVWVAEQLLGPIDIPLEELYAVSGYSLGATFLAIVIQPAIVEELAFRGVIFARLEPLLDTRAVVIVTAVMFMVVHLALLSLVFLVAMGLALGWLRARSGSLYPGMLLHLGHNAVVLWLAWPG